MKHINSTKRVSLNCKVQYELIEEDDEDNDGVIYNAHHPSR